MPEPLWKIRQRKGLSMNQLATKAGVPALSIKEYESGRAIRSADLPKLAKALYVEEWDIDITGQPKPRHERAGPTHPSPRAPSHPKRAEPAKEKARPAPSRSRPSQIKHLLAITSRHFGKDQDALEKELGKSLDALNRREASDLLSHYQNLLAESRSAGMLGDTEAKRRRAYLPEGVDEFELEYLTQQQQTRTLLHFSLFDGQQMSGYIVGFSPYSITIHDSETDHDVTLQKLAIAYYHTGEKT